jgi:hypothetical protein
MIKRLSVISALLLALAGCDLVNQKLGLEDPAQKEARTEAEAKAVGSACRHSGRAIEDCYAIYSWLPKAGIYAGWREMDEYMRQNQIETIVPQLPPSEPPGAAKKKKKATTEEAAAAPATAAAPASSKETEAKVAKDSEKAAEKH